MIKQVSWGEYATALVVIVTVYYIAVIFLYYRNDILKFLSGSQKVETAGQYGSSGLPPSPLVNNPAEKDRSILGNEQRSFERTTQLLSELHSLFEKQYVKEELITVLQVQLRDYSDLKDTSFYESINNFIEMESEEKCSVTLSEQELRRVWER